MPPDPTIPGPFDRGVSGAISLARSCMSGPASCGKELVTKGAFS